MNMLLFILNLCVNQEKTILWMFLILLNSYICLAIICLDEKIFGATGSVVSLFIIILLKCPRMCSHVLWWILVYLCNCLQRALLYLCIFDSGPLIHSSLTWYIETELSFLQIWAALHSLSWTLDCSVLLMLAENIAQCLFFGKQRTQQSLLIMIF